jgi:hypothetical protein
MCIEEEVRLRCTDNSGALTSISKNIIPLFKNPDNIPTIHESIERYNISKNPKVTSYNNCTIQTLP